MTRYYIIIFLTICLLCNNTHAGPCDDILNACHLTIQAEDASIENLKAEVKVLKQNLAEHESDTPWYWYVAAGMVGGLIGGIALTTK